MFFYDVLVRFTTFVTIREMTWQHFLVHRSESMICFLASNFLSKKHGMKHMILRLGHLRVSITVDEKCSSNIGWFAWISSTLPTFEIHTFFLMEANDQQIPLHYKSFIQTKASWISFCAFLYKKNQQKNMTKNRYSFTRPLKVQIVLEIWNRFGRKALYRRFRISEIKDINLRYLINYKYHLD